MDTEPNAVFVNHILATEKVSPTFTSSSVTLGASISQNMLMEELTYMVEQLHDAVSIIASSQFSEDTPLLSLQTRKNLQKLCQHAQTILTLTHAL